MKQKYIFIILSFIFIYFFGNQGSNIYIELILNSFLFLSLISFKQYLKTSKSNYLYFFIFLFSLSIYTDRCNNIFFNFFFIFLIYILRKKNKIIKYIFMYIFNLKFFVLVIFFYNYSISF